MLKLPDARYATEIYRNWGELEFIAVAIIAEISSWPVLVGVRYLI